MSHRSEQFVRQCIAASGIAIVDPRIAYELRPDLWASAQDCAITFRRTQKLDGTHRLIATIDGYGETSVFARSLDDLPRRIEWIAGRRVLGIKPAEPEPSPIAAPNLLHKQAEAKEAERIAALQRLAAEEPPAHDCTLRREILAAREELTRHHA